jgi:hypothetical protein
MRPLALPFKTDIIRPVKGLAMASPVEPGPAPAVARGCDAADSGADLWRFTDTMSDARDRPVVPAHENFQARREELSGLPLRDRFERIFASNLWGASSRSGIGSELSSTATLRERLPGFLADLGVRTVLDLPCGDFSWLSTLDLSVEYIGGDIVESLVDGNRRRFGRPDRQFVRLDLTADPLPPSDLVLCRDCLVHLSFANVLRALANVRQSGAHYLLTTTFLEHVDNADIEDGDWRMLNLQQPPFSLPPPEAILLEGCLEGDGAYADKALGLWRADQLPLQAAR